MNKKIFERNIIKMLDLYNKKQDKLYELSKGINNEGKERDVLNDFLTEINFLKNKENRVLAFSRIVELIETPLKILIEKEELKFEHANDIIDKAYIFTKNYHEKYQEDFIKELKESKLLTDFYFEIVSGVHDVGKTFSNFYIVWNNHIINGVNRELDIKFKKNKQEVIKFLNKKNLFDLGHNKKTAERCYSALVKDNGDGYKSEAYSVVFKKEVLEIVKALDSFIKNLSNFEDNIYDQKENYIKYLKSIKSAFTENNIDKLLEKWSKVDVAWMNITSPFQISHPLEFYEDKFRKAVAPEWDIRIKDDFMSESKILGNIIKMQEGFYDNIDKKEFSESYDFSLLNLNKIQLYISSQLLFYGSNLCGLPSAQVVPNDKKVSSEYGKKIFAYPKNVLDFQRKTPLLMLHTMTIEQSLLKKYRKILFSNKEQYYDIYDIETLGHEYGHLLWLTENTEVKMNKKTGVYKNIEEFKATTSALISFFMTKDKQNLKQEVIITHIIRCVNLLKYRKENSIVSYYCEALMHLDILLKSGIIYFKKDKVYMYFNDRNYKDLKKGYIEVYSKLIYIYLHKKDAGDFLFDFLVHHQGVYESKNKELEYFSKYFYELYKEIGSEIDEKVKKENYINSKKSKGFIRTLTDKLL